jgi:hypothetical protein
MSDTQDKAPEVRCVVVGDEKKIALSQEDRFIVITIDQAKDHHKALAHELALAEDS